MHNCSHLHSQFKPDSNHAPSPMYLHFNVKLNFCVCGVSVILYTKRTAGMLHNIIFLFANDPPRSVTTKTWWAAGLTTPTNKKQGVWGIQQLHTDTLPTNSPTSALQKTQKNKLDTTRKREIRAWERRNLPFPNLLCCRVVMMVLIWGCWVLRL